MQQPVRPKMTADQWEALASGGDYATLTADLHVLPYFLGNRFLFFFSDDPR